MSQEKPVFGVHLDVCVYVAVGPGEDAVEKAIEVLQTRKIARERFSASIKCPTSCTFADGTTYSTTFENMRDDT